MTTATQTQAPDQFANWRRRIAGEKLPILDGEPEPGFYRNRRKGQQASAVCYWTDTKSGKMRCRVDGTDIDLQRAMELWAFVSVDPVTHEAYKAKIETGKWPDMDEGAFKTLPENKPEIVAQAGHNRPPTDPVADLLEQVENASAGVEQYKKIGDDDTYARAQSLRSRLLELASDGDKKREIEKRPFLEEGRKVDKKWKPIIDRAQAAADLIRGYMKTWANEKDRRAAEQAAALSKQREEEIRRAEANDEPPPPSQPEPEPAKMPEVVKGAYGRAASSRLVPKATVKDQDKVYAVFKERQEVKDLLQKLAQKAVEAGATIDGVEVTQERDIR